MRRTRSALGIRGWSRGDRLAREVAHQLAILRRSAGITQASAARQVGISQGQISKLESGHASASVPLLAAIASVLGQDLTVKIYPAAAPLRDVAHLRLFARLRRRLVNLRWQLEVPLPIPGDRRAIDAMIAEPRIDCGFELEVRLLDVQATVRRIDLKQRDAQLGCMILVLADTRANRDAVGIAAPALASSFPLEARAVLGALRRGEAPPRNGILFV